MSKSEWAPNPKPYDLRERLLIFACLIVRVVQFLHTKGPIATRLSTQILDAGTSAGANYEEADDGSSARDKAAKRRITLRELKEVKFRLRVCRQTGFLTAAHDPLIQETTELIKIVATVIKNAEKNTNE